MSNKQMEIMAREHDMSAIDAELAKEVTESAVEGAVTGYKKVEEAVVSGYKKIEDSVVGGYKKIETGVVEGFGKVVDKCVEVLFTKDGESVEGAKARLSGKEDQ